MRRQVNFKAMKRESAAKKEQDKQPSKKVEGSIAELPVLYFGAKNNFIKFKEKLSIYVHAKFGKLGSIIDNAQEIEVQEVPVPADPLAFDADHDPFGLARATFTAKIQAREKLVAKLDEDRCGVFFAIYGQLSDESKSKVHEDAEWDESYATKDPLRLWLIVGAVHQGGATGVPVLDRLNGRNTYSSLLQGPNEKCLSFKERTVDALMRLEAVQL